MEIRLLGYKKENIWRWLTVFMHYKAGEKLKTCLDDFFCPIFQMLLGPIFIWGRQLLCEILMSP